MPKPSPIEKIRQELRAAGLRVTTARVAVLEQLAHSRRPLSHAELAEKLVPRGFDQATVYRNLMDLTDADLVSRAELGDHVWRFERRAGHKHHQSDHPHFVCVDCGEVTCLSDVDIKLSPPPGTKKSIIRELTEVLLKGHCGNCA